MTGNEDDFVGEFETKRANDGYGLVMDKGSAEKQEMARNFNDEVEVGSPMAEPEIETADLPMAAGGIYDEVAPGSEADKALGGEVATADSLGEGETVVGSADPVVSSPVTESTVKAEALPAAEADKGMSFGEAFKAARAAGKKAFDWNGKSFTTALKSEKAKPLPKAAPVAAPAKEPTPQAIAEAVFKDEPAPATGPARSTGGIGPDLNPAMQPKPGAKSIYANVGVSAPQKQVAPINVAGKDGSSRPAESVAEVMTDRKGARGG